MKWEIIIQLPGNFWLRSSYPGIFGVLGGAGGEGTSDEAIDGANVLGKSAVEGTVFGIGPGT